MSEPIVLARARIHPYVSASSDFFRLLAIVEGLIRFRESEVRAGNIASVELIDEILEGRLKT